MSYDQIASEEQIQKTVAALNANNFDTQVVETIEELKAAVLAEIPAGSQVFTATSVTLTESGLEGPLNEAPYVSVRGMFMPLYGQADKALEMRRIGSAADYSVGSAHAVTEDGKILVASRSGSQLPNEVYGASHVIFAIGANKLVKDLADGIKRIEEHVVPQEDTRAQAAYGMGTSFNKLLVFNKEDPGRVKVFIVKQKIGF
jgi:LUD domain